MKFRDHFSRIADAYRSARPTYPAALFELLADRVERRELAWDCATGNGQAAKGLAPWFDRVIATDGSSDQIARAEPVAGVEYRVAMAERCGLDDGSVDLVTVAQALHWLDHDAFYAEVRRVCRPGGMIAVWAYELATIAPAVDEVVHELYHDLLAGCWPPRRRFIEEGYRTIPFPFEDLELPPVEMSASWTFDELLAYLGTWSAVDRYRNDRGACPVEIVLERLRTAWGDTAAPRVVRWPLALRVGCVESATG